MDKIYESGQDYLERILMLKEKNKYVRSIDIANDMDVTRQSVHRAIKYFKENNYIIVEENGNINLTEKGLKVAKETLERHTVLTKLLIYIGNDEKTAEADACKIEHDISEKTFKLLKKKLKEIENKKD